MRCIEIAGLAVVLACCHANGIAQQKEILIGQVAPLSGPAATIGLPVTQAAHAYFRKVNSEGGVHRRKVVLIDRDDGFKPERTLEEVKQLAAQQNPIAFINVVGAPNNGDLVTTGLLEREGTPVVGAFTGATSVRALKSTHLFFVRASVESEARRMLEQVEVLGMNQVALVHANDGFGLDAKVHVERLAKEHSQTLVAVGKYEPATSDVSQAVQTIRAATPQAVFIFGTGPAAASFITEFRKSGGGALLLANSSTSPEVLVKFAGEAARGVGLVQVVPPLTKSSIPVVREYLDTLRKFGEPSWAPSAYGLEGFLAAKVLTQGLQRAGPDPTRALLLKSLGSLGSFDMGGLTVNYSPGSREGLKYVEIGIMNASGRLMN